MRFFVTLIGLTDAIAAVDRIRGEAGTKVETSMADTARWAQRSIQMLAPNDTGHYASTIGLFDESKGENYQYVIGTSEPYGARLEYGFYGTDSLNRRYNQSPRPHFGPVADVLPARMASHMLQQFS